MNSVIEHFDLGHHPASLVAESKKEFSATSAGVAEVCLTSLSFSHAFSPGQSRELRRGASLFLQ